MRVPGSSAFDHVSGVILVRPTKQMVRIATGRIVASMADDPRKVAVRPVERSSVSIHRERLPIDIELQGAITARKARASPFPAVIFAPHVHTSVKRHSYLGSMLIREAVSIASPWVNRQQWCHSAACHQSLLPVDRQGGNSR
jgi:hypothetical protein